MELLYVCRIDYNNINIHNDMITRDNASEVIDSRTLVEGIEIEVRGRRRWVRICSRLSDNSRNRRMKRSSD